MKVLRVFIILVAILAIVTVMWPFLPTPRHTTITSCMANMKQVATASALYAEAANRFLPPKDWVDATLPYGKNPELYGCPEVKPWGYAYLASMVGKRLDSIPNPKNELMFFEVDLLKKNLTGDLSLLAEPRHEGRSIFGYADTSARWTKRN